MEFTKQELSFVAQAEEGGKDEGIRELDDLQLALIGGGGGDVVFH